MNIEQIDDLDILQELINKKEAVLVYFNTQACNVGEAFFPKVENLLQISFPRIIFATVDINFSPKISAHYNAFVEPTILVFFDGKETIRKSRNIGLFELESAIKRPYQLIFE